MGTDSARGRDGTVGVGGGKKRMPSCNVTDSSYERFERMLTCHWSTIEGESCMMSIADTSTASRDERPADALSLSKQWNSIDWTKAERCIRHIQGRISKAYSDVSRPVRMGYCWLEPCAVKVARTVLRRGGGSNSFSLCAQHTWLGSSDPIHKPLCGL